MSLMGVPAEIPKVPGFSLAHLLSFRNRRLAWQMGLMNDFGDICRTNIGFFPVVVVSSAELGFRIAIATGT